MVLTQRGTRGDRGGQMSSGERDLGIRSKREKTKRILGQTVKKCRIGNSQVQK